MSSRDIVRVEVEVSHDQTCVRTGSQPQSPDKRLAANGLFEAAGHRVQPRAAPRNPVSRVRNETDAIVVLPHDRSHP